MIESVANILVHIPWMDVSDTCNGVVSVCDYGSGSVLQSVFLQL